MVYPVRSLALLFLVLAVALIANATASIRGYKSLLSTRKAKDVSDSSTLKVRP